MFEVPTRYRSSAKCSFCGDKGGTARRMFVGEKVYRHIVEARVTEQRYVICEFCVVKCQEDIKKFEEANE